MAEGPEIIIDLPDDDNFSDIGKSQQSIKKKSKNLMLEILDDEFERYINVANDLMQKLRRSNDLDVANKYIEKCKNMSLEVTKAKEYRNEFFKYFLKVLRTTVESELNVTELQSEEVVQKTSLYGSGRSSKSSQHSQPKTLETKRWSEDQKTYISAKKLPGFGLLIYMATTDRPDLGWQRFGFKDYQF